MQITKSSVSKVIVARCERGEDLYSCLDRLVQENKVRSGCFQVIGGVSRGRLGIFEDGEYRWAEEEGPLEIASCTGNVAMKEGKPFVHCHAVLSDPRGKTIAGHVGEGCIVDPMAEIHLTIYDGETKRRFDPDTGLWILHL